MSHCVSYKTERTSETSELKYLESSTGSVMVGTDLSYEIFEHTESLSSALGATTQLTVIEGGKDDLKSFAKKITTGSLAIPDELLSIAKEVADGKIDSRTAEQWARDLSRQLAQWKD